MAIPLPNTFSRLLLSIAPSYVVSSYCLYRGGVRNVPSHLVCTQQRISEAIVTLRDLGMERFVLRASNLAAELDAVIPATPEKRETYPARLSERDVEVLRLAAKGRSNRQITDQLVPSPKTVARHMSNIFDKLGVQNRSGASLSPFCGIFANS